TASPYSRTTDVMRRVDVPNFDITSSPIYSRFKPRERAQTTRGGTLTHSLFPSTVFPGKFSRVVGIESIILKYSTMNAFAGLTASSLMGLQTFDAARMLFLPSMRLSSEKRAPDRSQNLVTCR